MKSKLPINNKMLKKLNDICKFNSLKLEYEQGSYYKVEKTNLNYIEPHKFKIVVGNVLILVLCYDNEHLFLYDRAKIITINKIRELIYELKKNNNT